MTVDPAMDIEAAKRKEIEDQQQQQHGHESEDDEVDEEGAANGAGGMSHLDPFLLIPFIL